MGGPQPTEPPTQPCYGCSCCQLWQDALQLLRDQAQRHVAGEIRLAPCDPECLICGDVEWQAPPVPDDDARAQMRQQLLAGIDLAIPMPPAGGWDDGVPGG